MTDRQRLELVHHLVAGDFADDIEWFMFKGLDFTQEQAKEMAELIGRLYLLVHPAVSECSHDDWEKTNEKDLLMMQD